MEACKYARGRSGEAGGKIVAIVCLLCLAKGRVLNALSGLGFKWILTSSCAWEQC